LKLGDHGLSRDGFVALLMMTATPVWAVVYNLVAPSEPHAVGAEVRLNLLILNPGTAETVMTVDENLEGVLTGDRKTWKVKLVAPAMGGAMLIAPGGFTVREFLVTLPKDAEGRLVLDITTPTPARVAIEARGQVAQSKSVRAPLTNYVPQRTAEAAIKRAFAGRFAPHEATYIAFGNEPQAAKFQFSFKYRILGEKAGLGEKVPALRGVYFGFTQRSLWDIEGESSPFYDTSYLPELMFESQAVLEPESTGGFTWLGYQAGVRHESNGRTGFTSRSMNTVYFRPGFSLGRLDGWSLIVAPRFSVYVADLSNNPDIVDYRGHVELLAAFGKNDSVALAVTARLGRSGRKGSVQADLTLPVKFDHLFDFATYVIVQSWNGYGESLLDYDKNSSALRLGFSLVR